MQVATVKTSPEPITANNSQDIQKNEWTCVNWYNTVFEIAASKTSRVFGHVVAGFVSVFTFIPALTVDLTHAVINLYDRNISRVQTPVQNQVSTAVLPASVASDISAQSVPGFVGLTPAQIRVSSCDLSTSSTNGLSGQLSESTNAAKELPISVTKQKPLAYSHQYSLQPTLTKDAENDGIPPASEQSPPELSEEQDLSAFIKWLDDKAGEHGLLIDKSARIMQRAGRSYLRRRERLKAFIKWLDDKTGEHGLLIDKSARIMQRAGRSYLRRRERLKAFIKWLNDKTGEHGQLIDKSARIIQGVGRSYLRRKGALSTAALAEYKPLCNLGSAMLMPRAEAGFTRVALPEAYPEIVLKASLNRSVHRFIQMLLMRKELKELGCSHLIIPRAIPVKNFLIEERLPISVDSFDNMRLYCSQPDLFDEAVREMVRLSTVCDITSDLLDLRIHPLCKSAGVKEFVRYDNLPLYKVSIDGVEQGRLGLIDLEHMGHTQDGETLRSITRIFPYHHDIIKEEADRLGIPYDDEILKAAVADGTKYLDAGYEDHYKWLQEKGVLDKFEDWNLDLSQERMNDVKKAVANELMSMNEGKILAKGVGFTVRSSQGFLKDGARSAEILSDGITETVIKNLTRAINENFRQNAEGKTPAQLAKSNPVKLRSLLTEKKQIIEGVKVCFRPSDHYEPKYHDKTCLIITRHECMIGKLVDVIFDELVNGGEMQSHNKTVVEGLVNAYWIRC